MQQLILILHILIAISLVALVLIQHGKGADIGAAFGSGASQTVFGSQGSGSFLMKLTSMLAVGFFVTSLLLSYLATQGGKQTPAPVIQLPPASQVAPDKSLPQDNHIPGKNN